MSHSYSKKLDRRHQGNRKKIEYEHCYSYIIRKKQWIIKYHARYTVNFPVIEPLVLEHEDKNVVFDTLVTHTDEFADQFYQLLPQVERNELEMPNINIIQDVLVKGVLQDQQPLNTLDEPMAGQQRTNRVDDEEAGKNEAAKENLPEKGVPHLEEQTFSKESALDKIMGKLKQRRLDREAKERRAKLETTGSTKEDVNRRTETDEEPEEVEIKGNRQAGTNDDEQPEKFEIAPAISPQSSDLQGNRIVDIQYLLNQCMAQQQSHQQDCMYGLLQVFTETRKGLNTQISLKCNLCEFLCKVPSQNPLSNFDVNKAAVWATIVRGNGLKNLKETLAILNLPPISQHLLRKIENELHDLWWNQLVDSMREAAKEERQHAQEIGDVDEDGIPFITVYADAGWAFRSYGHRYTAASGVAVIVGKHTKKILFIGVRNKKCIICTRAGNLNTPPKEHRCFKNFDGSSPAMEASIVVEGFNESIPKYGLKYRYLISDGDSSVYARVQREVTYGAEVRKIFCKNHLIKNFGSALYKLQGDTTIGSEARKHVTKKYIKDIEKCITSTIYRNAHGNVEHLKEELTVLSSHCFGDHLQCQDTFCEKAQTVENGQKMREVIATGILDNINSVLQKFVISQSHKLIENETNNRAEMFMSILCKFNAGKRMNFTGRGSFETRCFASALRYNMGANWQLQSWEKAYGTESGCFFQKFMEECENEIQYERSRSDRKRKRKGDDLQQEPTAKRPRNLEKEYGPNAEQGEMTPEEYHSEKNRFLRKLQVTAEEISQIEEDTRGQWTNPLFVKLRGIRLSASNFHKIWKKRPTTCPDATIRAIVFPRQFDNAAVQYGKTKEELVIRRFSTEHEIPVRESGLWIDQSYHFLAATPDGVVTNDSALVEVKCFYKAHKENLTFTSAVTSKTISNFCLQYSDEPNGTQELRLKKTHPYYTQIQGQLNICQKDKCYFVCYINDQQPLHVETINRDQQLWLTQILPKLRDFYMDHLLPAFIRKGSR